MKQWHGGICHLPIVGMSPAPRLEIHCDRWDETILVSLTLLTSVSEVDSLSLEHARRNAQYNRLQDRIAIIAADPAGQIFGPLTDQCESFTLLQ